MRSHPERHHRRSIRLKGYDYRQAGAYFVTICTQDRAFLFGQVVHDEMQLNDAGKMVYDVWNDLPAFYPGVQTDAFIYADAVKRLGWKPFRGRLWQRNYYEHIIRNKESLNRIREYILTNPMRWALARENPHRVGVDEFDTWLDSVVKESNGETNARR